MDYEKKCNWALGENKPNSKPISRQLKSLPRPCRIGTTACGCSDRWFPAGIENRILLPYKRVVDMLCASKAQGCS